TFTCWADAEPGMSAVPVQRRAAKNRPWVAVDFTVDGSLTQVFWRHAWGAPCEIRLFLRSPNNKVISPPSPHESSHPNHDMAVYSGLQTRRAALAGPLSVGQQELGID